MPKCPNRDSSESRHCPIGLRDGIEELVADYKQAQTQIETLRTLRSCAEDQRVWSNEFEASLETVLNAIASRQHEIAQLVAASRAKSVHDLRAKALVLRDWCSPEDGEILDMLAASICDDLTNDDIGPLAQNSPDPRNSDA